MDKVITIEIEYQAICISIMLCDINTILFVFRDSCVVFL